MRASSQVTAIANADHGAERGDQREHRRRGDHEADRDDRATISPAKIASSGNSGAGRVRGWGRDGRPFRGSSGSFQSLGEGTAGRAAVSSGSAARAVRKPASARGEPGGARVRGEVARHAAVGDLAGRRPQRPRARRARHGGQRGAAQEPRRAAGQQHAAQRGLVGTGVDVGAQLGGDRARGDLGLLGGEARPA